MTLLGIFGFGLIAFALCFLGYLIRDFMKLMREWDSEREGTL